MSKRILVIGNLEQRLKDQISFCEKLYQANPEWVFHFLICRKDNSELLDKTPFSYACSVVTPPAKKHRAPSSKPSTPSIFTTFKQTLKRAFPFEVYRFIRFMNTLRLETQFVKRAFSEFKPDLVLLNGDRHLWLEPSALKLCHEQNIPNLTPYFTQSGDEAPLKLREGNPVVEQSWQSPFLTHLCCLLFSSQCLKNHAKKILFFPPHVLLSLKLMGTLSRYPWYIGNGLTSTICVDNQHTFERYTTNGVSPEKLQVMGDFSYDTLFKNFEQQTSLKETLIKDYDLDPNKKLIICALPQLAEHNLLDWPTHDKEIDFLVGTLCKSNANVLLSLHPKMDFNHYKRLETTYPCKLLNQRLYDVLPAADMFVATYSSTVIWSILCQIQTIVVDFYGLNYQMFDFLSELSIVTDKVLLSSVIASKLETEPNCQLDWERLSRDDVFDGNVFSRYETFIKGLAVVLKS